jgi:hypothetical protein
LRRLKRRKKLNEMILAVALALCMVDGFHDHVEGRKNYSPLVLGLEKFKF